MTQVSHPQVDGAVESHAGESEGRGVLALSFVGCFSGPINLSRCRDRPGGWWTAQLINFLLHHPQLIFERLDIRGIVGASNSGRRTQGGDSNDKPYAEVRTI
jgi:hypothetical protein